MFFCPNCNNAYDISKDIAHLQTGGVDMSKLLDNILSGESEDNIKKDIDKMNITALLKSPEYKKLSSKDKELIYNRLQDSLPKDKKDLLKNRSTDAVESNKTYFICKNCMYSTPIKDGTKLYSKTSEDIKSTYKTDNIDVKFYSSVLPLTRKYVCPNDTCISHKDPSLKEASMFRSNNTFAIKYICRACKTYWSV